MIRIQPASEYPGGLHALIVRLQQIPAFASLCEDQAGPLANSELHHIDAGEIFVRPGDLVHHLWIHLSGHVQLHYRPEGPAAGQDDFLVLDSQGGELLGETPALSGKPTRALGKTLAPALMLRIDIADFWKLMMECDAVRESVIGGMAQRIQEIQMQVMQREKMISIGTAAAGLMHELNNPSAAAQRAAAQLRKNLVRMQETSMRFPENPLSPAALQCLRDLQRTAYFGSAPSSLGSLEESGREEELADWLTEHRVGDAYEVAAMLSPRGIRPADLDCAVQVMDEVQFGDVLQWLGGLSCSLDLLQTVESSVTRINELVGAVKMYSHSCAADQNLNVHDTIKSAIMILLHKIRFKDIQLNKSFAKDLPPLHVVTDGIPQIWINLLDNAIDAVPAGGNINITTELVHDAAGSWIQVIVQDSGPGIPAEVLPHIFDPFFTTKKAGAGTGLGLDIAQRKVHQCGGTIHAASAPGDTKFIVRLPIRAQADDGVAQSIAAVPAT